MNEVQFTADGRVLTAKISIEGDQQLIEFNLSSDAVCILHWGVRGVGEGWRRPPESMWPAGSRSADALSVDTPFAKVGEGQSRVTIRQAAPFKIRGLSFVLFFPETKRWVKDGSKDYFLPLRTDSASPDLSELSDVIADAEQSPSWSLMHRYNLCHDLLQDVRADARILPLLFVWLRYSAIRQLDWQRQYNTKPRELSHALDRLTVRLAGISRQGPAQAFWVRQLLSTLGRGGEGQQVRDEILNIMHRHHIKETHGKFMEEWHQKLHNNTTSDDVIICEAYLSFLRSKGDLGAFYSTLERGGVTRDRLRRFERPIKTDPDYFGDKADGLIHDFTRYLEILKSVHSGTDFNSAFAAASRHMGAELKKSISEISGLRNSNADPITVAERLTSAREALLASYSSAKDDASLRDLLFMDLALEALFRQSIEKLGIGALDTEKLAKFLHLAIRQTVLTAGDDEWRCCSRHWAALLGAPRDAGVWATHAISVAGRIGRAVQDASSTIYSELQPKAESLGKALKVQDWTIPLFSEEVVRGNVVFMLSLLLRRLDALLRSAAGLGGWQVVSSRPARGKVRVVDSLMAVQGQRFPEPTVLVTDAVSGNEDIPEGVTAVITTATLDLVSHAAVRARNVGILCATCFDAEPYALLKKSEGQWIALDVSPAGDVLQQKTDGPQAAASTQVAQKAAPALRRRNFTKWAISSAEFNFDLVGGKSNNLNKLRGRMPDWIEFPKSMALPFGVFEQLLDQSCNRQLKTQYGALLERVESDVTGTLTKVRALIGELQPIPEFEAALQQSWKKTELPALNWNEAWKAIKQVWASKWNDRAYLSRRALGIPHDALTMAVLIQEVVEAEYAYVLHTVNPITGNCGEIFGEIVLGLGETLVGNHPGSALGFIYSRADGRKKIVSYPGKSYGLYGAGLIFRSDSNGEDLEDFAGAGLYDSILGRAPEQRRLDYSAEPLLWDKGFRDAMIDKIAHIGMETEKVFGAPQDIEGAIRQGRSFVVQTRAQVGLK